MLEEFKKYMESEEGKKSVEEYFGKLQRDGDRVDQWVEKLKSNYENNIDDLIEKLINKYYSDEYKKREYSLGYEPRESLFWLVWSYAEKYCEQCNDVNYYNMFTSNAYYIGSYVIQVMNGQGSVIKIEKK